MNGIDSLITKVQDYNSSADFDLIKKAYEFAQARHVEQKRLSGESLFSHLLKVANLVADIRLDETAIAAALLHESLRSGCPLPELEREFGRPVSFCVETLSQLSQNQLSPVDPRLAENVEKTFLLLAKDVRIALIRLADRVDNVWTIKSLPEKDQIWAAKQALQFYAPIAEILGVYQFKRELEDGAFAIIHPETYEEIAKRLSLDRKEMEEAIVHLKRRLLRELAETNVIPVKIFGRAKHIYSIWRKLLRYQKEGKVKNLLVQRIYDQMALMVIMKEIPDCYQVLGVVNKIFTVLPEEFDDYIARPKPNGYRALHTIIKDEKGRVFEIQIKTQPMHEENEFGPAAHFHYKLEGGKYVSSASSQETSWVRRLEDWSKANVEEIFGEKIFVFSPKRDVYELPKGATPIDFAYAVHSDLGDEVKGAMVNGKMVPLDYQLKNGETVYILRKEGAKPSGKWLRFVVTSQARREISKCARKEL
jgi:GTP pyrophosphokinase